VFYDGFEYDINPEKYQRIEGRIYEDSMISSIESNIEVHK
jgi:hypothetical protein